MNELNKSYLNLPTDLQNIINIKCLQLIKVQFNKVLEELMFKIYCECYDDYDAALCDYCHSIYGVDYW